MFTYLKKCRFTLFAEIKVISEEANERWKLFLWQAHTKLLSVIKNTHKEVHQGRSYQFDSKMKNRKTWICVKVLFKNVKNFSCVWKHVLVLLYKRNIHWAGTWVHYLFRIFIDVLCKLICGFASVVNYKVINSL